MEAAKDGRCAERGVPRTCGVKERAALKRAIRKSIRAFLLFLAVPRNNMSRSSKKGPCVDPKLVKKVSRLTAGSRAVVKTWARRSQISPEMIGFTFGVHNGKDFIPVTVVEDMVGHRLGEFSPTRRFTRHGGKMQKELEMKAAEVAKTAAPSAGAPAPAAPVAKK